MDHSQEIAAIRETVRALTPEAAALRHELHAHPEIRFEEHWTADRISAFLDEAGIPHTRGHARGTGIVATLGSGEPTVGLRADMDALEIQEETGLPYASETPGRMHACGHDGHMACLCGVAKVLSRHADLLGGQVKFIFQPAEEQAAGGRWIVEEGLLDGVDRVFAFHGWPSAKLGTIGVRSGCVMASADFFRVEVEGAGGHGADPGSTVDPTLVAAHIVTALQAVVSREVDPWEPAVLTVAQLRSGSSSNIIPDRAWMEGTIRTLSPAVRAHVRQAIERVSTNVAQAFRARASVTFGSDDAYPPLFNDPGATDLARQTIREVFSKESIEELAHPFMVAEDFAFYLEKVPGAFLFLGIAPPDQDEYPALHTSRYDFNDHALPIGMELMANIALRALCTS